MTVLVAIPPARRIDLVVSPLDGDGQHVVKDLRSGQFFKLAAEESFLLLQLDGERSVESILAAFEARFGQPLSEEELDDFVDLARDQGFLRRDPRADDDDREGAGVAPEDELLRALRNWPIPGGPIPEPKPKVSKRGRQSFLFWRLPLYDPDRLFNALEPRLRFVWTRAFLFVTAVGIPGAFALVWIERAAVVAQAPAGLTWGTVLLAWMTLVVVTTLHEFAHGLTCKHYGGEVHEIGFLLLYFMPCFYCNVSDSWLFPERWKRLLVTLAGGYCDLILWALGVFVWRVTLPGTWINYEAWLVLSICGFRILLNFNPLLKMDGYYLAIDVLGVPNLRRLARERLMGYLRWVLWGATRPLPESRGKLLLGFGLVTWLFSLVFFSLMLLGLGRVMNARAGVAGLGWTVLLGLVSARRLLRGFSAGEVKAMVRTRRQRTALWAIGIGSLTVMAGTIKVEDRASGPLQLRPSRRVDLRAPVAGFLKVVELDEGDHVSAGQLVARLEVPDLESRTVQKRAETREVEAKLRMLKVGPRPEAVHEQRHRVERATAWRDLARHDLERSRRSYEEEIIALHEQVHQGRVELDRANELFRRARKLLDRQALQVEQFQDAEKACRIAEAQSRQAEARKRAREAEGTLKAEAELARRENELADDRAALRLLEIGSRPEEIEAETAHLARIEEEARYLEGLQDRLRILSPISGVVTTPRLVERIGQHLAEGQLIATIEDLSVFEAEIGLPEQDATRVRPGQEIKIKARGLPFDSFLTKVERVAPSTARVQAHAAPTTTAPTPAPETASNRGEMPATVVVYCRLDKPSNELRMGMTGHARVYFGPRPIGAIAVDRVLRLIRTEFWW